MSIHLEAMHGDISSSLIITGDPLRAKHIAERMLTKIICYNTIRGMFGFTGIYKGRRISVQGTGMGIPSTAIYVNEVISEYGVKKIIRVGTCGAIQPEIKLGQLVVATRAFTDSGMEAVAPITTPQNSSSELLQSSIALAKALDIQLIVGDVFSTDTFYSDHSNRWDEWTKKGLLGVEMETSILYALAAKYKVDALTILEVSDNILTKENVTSAAREKVSHSIMQLALELL